MNCKHVLKPLIHSGRSLWFVLMFGFFPIGVNGQIEITTASLPDGMEMVPYDVQLQALGGVGPYRWFTTGDVIAWGAGKTDTGNAPEHGQSIVPENLDDIISIASGSWHNLGLKVDGTVVAWGRHYEGQTNVPPDLEDVVSILAGGSHSVALKSDGTAVAWGANWYGQSTIPPEWSNVKELAAGGWHTLALLANGTVEVVGANNLNQSNIPDALSDVISISAGQWHSLALKSDGTVVGWGGDGNGQGNVPSGLSDVIAIAAGGWHSLALKSDGTLVGWGSNWSGQTAIPEGLDDVVAISAGGVHSFAVKSDGTVVSWGLNDEGQTDIPPEIAGGVLMVSAGDYHSLALMSNMLPEGVNLTQSGRLLGTPQQQDNLKVDINVSDVFGERSRMVFDLTINDNPNTRPEISTFMPSQTDLAMFASASQTFSITASDPEGQPLSYAWTLNGSPVGLDSPQLTLGEVDWVIGENIVRVTVSDDLWTDQVYQEWTVDTSSSLASISGTVTGPDGTTPLESIYVMVYQPHPQWGYWQINYDLSTYTDVNGDYKLEDLTPGTYRIGFKDWSGDYIEEYYDDSSALDHSFSLVLAEGNQVMGIDASLSVASKFTGTVT